MSWIGMSNPTVCNCNHLNNLISLCATHLESFVKVSRLSTAFTINTKCKTSRRSPACLDTPIFNICSKIA